MNFKYLRYIFAAVVVAAMSLLPSCSDEIEYIQPDITDGEVSLSGEVIFKPLAVADVKTESRAAAPAGSTFKTINSLYILFFDAERNIVKEYSGPVTYDLTDVERPSDMNQGQTTAESKTPSASFKKTVRGGQYYVYAVANVDAATLNDVNTIDELRSITLTWDSENMNNNLAMFGVFTTASANTGVVDNTTFEDNVLLTLSRTENQIHSWMRRATSKVTVAFDGKGLLNDVTVYIRRARLVDVASECPLGKSLEADKITNTESSFVIDYGTGEETAWASWPAVDNKHNLDSYTEPGAKEPINMHSEMARALPCYENKQGKRDGKPKLPDANGDGIIDNPDASVYKKDGVEKGTYLEIEGYYVSNHKNYTTQGAIKYRFMLGMNAENDFDVIRNHHYKVTLSLKGFGNDVDWHVDFNEMNFSVTEPKDVNYQGKFFVPDEKYSGFNLGHTFSDQNTIKVTSHTGTDNSAKFDNFEIFYKYDGQPTSTREDGFTSELPSWMEAPKFGEIINNRTQDVTFVVKSDYTEIDIDDRLKKNTPKGNATSPYNLSNSTGASSIEETANCYIVDAPGVYSFPLVYGNACVNGEANTAAYTSTEGLGNFINHQWMGISDPFIVNNTNCTPAKAELLWQDEQGLIKTSSVKYDANAFKVNGQSMGGITFEIGNIQQGNALLAIKDVNGLIMWSWHIWVTDLSFDKTVTVTNNLGRYNMMNFNLGWCADKEDNVRKKLRYYPEKSCEIKIVNSHNAEQTVKIVRHPHTVMPRGDNPAYQWGRKDPFPGCIAIMENSTKGKNKKLYLGDGTKTRETDPERFWLESDKNNDREGERKKTHEVLHLRTLYPEKWHNPPRTKIGPEQYTSNNNTFSNLWCVGDGTIFSVKHKTVYDPCPPGYQVPHHNAYSGFTTTGFASVDPREWLDVAESNMLAEYYGGVDKISSQIVEFYTDKSRLEYIAFPINGYRDWDAAAEVYRFGAIGYVWSNSYYDDNNSYYLEIQRHYYPNKDWEYKVVNEKGEPLYDDGRFVRPNNSFFNCDGCPVRPVAYM